MEAARSCLPPFPQNLLSFYSRQPRGAQPSRARPTTAAGVGVRAQVGPHIVVFKTHVDAFDAWDESIVHQLQELAQQHGESITNSFLT